MPSFLPLPTGRPVLLMLDYDGTLLPMAHRYDEAFLSDAHQDVLTALARTPGIELAIVSGRSIDQLRGFMPRVVNGPVWLVGLHGGEIYDSKIGADKLKPNDAFKTRIDGLRTYLKERQIEALPGIFLEDKTYTLCIHFREATPEVAQQAQDILKAGIDTLEMAGEFMLRPGKGLLEAVPKVFHKGRGVKALIDLVVESLDGATPGMLYLGDDITDYDAFRILHNIGGLSGYVGNTMPNDAPPVDFTLGDIDAVYAYLEALRQDVVQDLQPA